MRDEFLRRALAGWLIAAALAAPWSSRADSAGHAPVTVFAASSLKNAFDETAAAFTASSGLPVRLSYAASSAIARQIEEGAPVDVFVSADTGWMDYLQTRGLIVAGSRHDLLTNHLALIAPSGSRTRLRVVPGIAIAAALGSGRLAIAGPEVPAGRYAREALTRLGVYDTVKDRLAPAENVRAALTFVAQGAAPLGIVYDTDALVETRVRIIGLFPDTSHAKIVYPAALVAASRNADGAAFLRFLSDPKAVAVFRKYGFKTVK